MTPTALSRAVARRGRELPAERPSSDLIDLSTDELVGSTPETVRKATVASLERHLADHYTRRTGVAPLCRAVADYLARFDANVDPETGVIITGGIPETRFVTLRALAAGKTIYLPRPAPLPVYAPAAHLAGAELRFFDPAGELPASSGDLMVIPNPNPATGQLYPAEMLRRLAAAAQAGGLTVIADETAAPLLRPGLAFTPLAALPEAADRTLTLGSFANTPGLAAWQVAWFAGPATLVSTAGQLKQAMTICSPAASQYAALAAFAQPDQHLSAQNVERIEAVVALLERLGIAYREPHTVVYVVANVGALGGGDVVATACAQHGVRVVSGSAFGSPATVRISATGDRFAEALSRLETALTGLVGEKEEAS